MLPLNRAHVKLRAQAANALLLRPTPSHLAAELTSWNKANTVSQDHPTQRAPANPEDKPLQLSTTAETVQDQHPLANVFQFAWHNEQIYSQIKFDKCRTTFLLVDTFTE
jgi:hypothetical protein